MTSPIGSPDTDLKSSTPDEDRRFLFAGRYYRYDYGRIVARLGKESDHALAAEIGCTFELVRALRHELGLPAYALGAEVNRYLGKETDAELSRRFGITAATIRARRIKRGIPPASVKASNAHRKLRAYLEALNS